MLLNVVILFNLYFIDGFLVKLCRIFIRKLSI